MKTLLLALTSALLLLSADSSRSQLMETFIGEGGQSGGPPPVNPCAASGNKLDFSQINGCNLVWAGH